MSDYICRKANLDDIDAIDEIQESVFTTEQDIPVDMLSVDESNQPVWYVIEKEGTIVGTCCCWRERGLVHFGRLAIIQEERGNRLGEQLVQYAFDDIFANGVDKLYMECRDSSVHIMSKLGAEVFGETFEFFGDACTPVILRKEDYHHSDNG